MSDRATQPQRITKHDLEVVVEAMDKLRAALRVEEEEKSALPEQISGHEWVCVTTSGWRGMCSCGQFGQDDPRRLVTHAEWQAHLASVAQAAPPSVDALEAQCRKFVLENETTTRKMRGRPVTHEEALVSAQRLINSHFHNPDGARVSIPVRADNDDVLVMDYIGEQQERDAQAQASLAAARAQALEEAAKQCEELNGSIKNGDRLTDGKNVRIFLQMAASEIRSLTPSDSTALAKLLAEERRPWEESLREIMDLVESGSLVRDISGDLEPGWAIKQIPLVTALAKAHDLLAARIAERKGEQPKP